MMHQATPSTRPTKSILRAKHTQKYQSITVIYIVATAFALSHTNSAAANMRGLMQESPLNVCQILDYAAKWHPEQTVVSRQVEGGILVTTYSELHKRARLCAMALQGLGVR